MTALEVSGLVAARGRRPVLREVSFLAERGVHAVLGPNGAGKSTLLGALVGQVPISAGRALWAGVPLGRGAGRLGDLGWLPQDLRFPGAMRVREVVEYAAWTRGIDRSDPRVGQALSFGDVQAHAERRVGQLSGGERRRVGLAASTVGSPGLVLLDEPTTGLDPLQRQDLHERIVELGRTRTVLLATHLLEDVEAAAEHVVLLAAGEVRFNGPVEEFIGTPERSIEALRRAVVHRMGGRT